MARRAVIFDLDGTLLDTLDDLADAANATLQAFDCPTHPVDAYRIFVGEGAAQLVWKILPEARRDEETVDRFLEAFGDEYGRRWDAKSRPYEGVSEMLDELTARGTPMAILSNKPHPFTRTCVEGLLARWDFAAVYGHSEETPRKPDPTGALNVLAELDVAPDEVLYVGDTSTDMQTAKAAGLFAVGVLWGFRDRDELESSGADAIIDHPARIVELLDDSR